MTGSTLKLVASHVANSVDIWTRFFLKSRKASHSAKAKVHLSIVQLLRHAVGEMRLTKARCGCPGVVSFPPRVPVIEAAGAADDIANDFHASSHASELPSFTFFCGRRDDFGHRFTEAGDANWLPCLSDFFQDAETLGFELGDGDFFHTFHRLWSMSMAKLGEWRQALGG
jgi:hypothetical protein